MMTCKDGCEYAESVGMPQYQCDKICQYDREPIRPIVAEQQGGGWIPIESAPKDGTRFLGLTWDGIVKQGYWSSGYFWADGSISCQSFTHWQPLPAPPSTT